MYGYRMLRCQCRQRGNVEEHAGFIVGVKQRGEGRVAAQLPCPLRRIKAPILIDTHIVYLVPLGLQLLHNSQDGGVFHGRGDDVSSLWMELQRPVYGRIKAFRSSTGEHDFLGARADKRRDLLTSAFDTMAHGLPELVDARRISKRALQKGQHGLHDLGQGLRGGVIVEVKCCHVAITRVILTAR